MSGKAGKPEVDGGDSTRGLVELAEFLFGAGEVDLEAFDLAAPALALGFGDASQRVVSDCGDPVSLGGVWPQQAAP
jgi:hypothetical protein